MPVCTLTWAHAWKSEDHFPETVLSFMWFQGLNRLWDLATSTLSRYGAVYSMFGSISFLILKIRTIFLLEPGVERKTNEYKCTITIFVSYCLYMCCTELTYLVTPLPLSAISSPYLFI